MDENGYEVALSHDVPTRRIAAIALLLIVSWQVRAEVSETITVTAAKTETRLADTPASVVVLSGGTLRDAPSPAVDDALRQVTGFTLFRRAGSRTANPTTQGVSLRGIGASGASRALILDDGIPLNDPFGGWIFWGRVPRSAIARAEVLRGGASDLYGSAAMGGVVQFVRRTDPALFLEASAGNEETAASSLFVGRQRGDWSGSLAADLFTTAGFVPVRPSERGSIDERAGSEHAGVDATVRHRALFSRLSLYRESRNNGTPLTTNETTIRQLAAGGELGAGGGLLSGRAYGSDEEYAQTFSAVAGDRNSERLTVEQSVPSRGAGGSAQWTRGIAGRHVVVAGSELRYASGSSEELRHTPAGQFQVDAGGLQRSVAVYAEDVFTAGSATITAGVRADGWRNEGEGASRSDRAISPRLSMLWRAGELLSFSASAYRAFRAPTLNELYRGFRVGNVVTLPNAELSAERLTGFEVGARARNVRLTLFRMEVTDAIANVTLSEEGSTITRQRQNLGRTRSSGAELDAAWTFGRHLRASASWMLVDARVAAGALEGNRIPQVPRNQATAQLLWSARTTIALQSRWSSAQFDDDRNQLPLRGYLVADLFVSHPVAPALELTLSAENLFDRGVEVSATPVVTLGQPRAFRLGLRYAPR